MAASTPKVNGTNGSTSTSMTGATSTWIVVGASRGIGLQFVTALLDRSPRNQVIAVVRNPETAGELWSIAAGQDQPGRCLIDICDVRMLDSIEGFIARLKASVSNGMNVEGVILNAGILQYPNRATETSFEVFANHLSTNTIGPIIIAQKILQVTASKPPSKMVFLSSDSGSATKFLEYEDGFAYYAASKAALNQALRHMSRELKRKGKQWEEVCVLAMHPGEVQTDMANIDIAWDVEGIISPQESVSGMLRVIGQKTKKDSGTFWCWDGRNLLRNTLGKALVATCDDTYLSSLYTVTYSAYATQYPDGKIVCGPPASEEEHACMATHNALR